MLLQQTRKVSCTKILPGDLCIQSLQESVRVERRVGQGSFGEVYCAQRKAGGEKIALKKLRVSNNSIGIPAAFLKELLV